MRNLTEGSIVGSLVTLAVPIVLTNLLHTAYQLTDTFWVGRLGAEAVAAVSLSFPFIFLMITLGGGFTLAGTILVAQNKGKKDSEQVNHVASQTVLLMFLVSVVISVCGYFLAEPALRLMNPAPNVLPDAVSYLKISFSGMIFMFSFFVFQSLMRGVGETKLPLRVVFTTVLLNLFLDPLFIMGWGPVPGFGVSGAAVATIFTQGIAAVIGLLILMRGNHELKVSFKKFHFDKALVKQMFFLGLPSSIEQSMKALGLTIVSYLVASFGTVIVASYGIGIRILSFVIIPAFGLSMATSTLVGQNMGAEKPERAEAVGNKSSLVAFFLILFISVFVFLFAEPITRTFIPDDEEVIAKASYFVKFLSLAFPFLSLQLNLSGVFSGSGNTKISMIFSLVSLWVLEFPLTYLLSKHTYLHEVGIWMAVPIATFITTMFSLSYFKMGRWKNTKLLQARTKEQKLEEAVRDEAMIEEGVI